MTGVWAARDHRLPESGTPRVREILRALQQVLPDTAASHLTAGLLLGLRMPRSLRVGIPIHVTRWAPGRAPRLAGVQGHVAQVPPADRWTSGTLRVIGPVRTVVDLAAMSTGPSRYVFGDDWVVALVDGMINEHRTGIRAGMPPMRSLELVREDLARMATLRGVARVRMSLERAQPGVDSALETHARLALARQGFTEFVTDHEIRVPGAGSAYPDLADRRRRISVQVEGPHHDGKDQRVRDITRLRITEAAGWKEVRVSGRDIFAQRPGNRPHIVKLVLDPLHQRLDRSA